MTGCGRPPPVHARPFGCNMMKRITRLAALLALVVTMVTDGSVNQKQLCTTDGGDGLCAAYYMQTVRIRKLHLVRPDLILFPVSYETLC